MMAGNGKGLEPTAGRWVVEEYLQRKAMAEIGLTSDLGRLPAWKVDAFYAIAGRVSDYQAKERERQSRKKR